MSGAEAVLIGVVLIVISGQAGMAFLLHVWARRVAEQKKTPAYRALRWLPLAAAALFVVTGVASVVLVVRSFSHVAASAPEEKARVLAAAISESMNAIALGGLVSWAALLASATASFLGSRRRPS